MSFESLLDLANQFESVGDHESAIKILQLMESL